MSLKCPAEHAASANHFGKKKRTDGSAGGTNR